MSEVAVSEITLDDLPDWGENYALLSLRRVRKSLKLHLCAKTGHEIAPGSSYTRVAYLIEGRKRQAVTVCLCDSACHEEGEE